MWSVAVSGSDEGVDGRFRIEQLEWRGEKKVIRRKKVPCERE